MYATSRNCTLLHLLTSGATSRVKRCEVAQTSLAEYKNQVSTTAEVESSHLGLQAYEISRMHGAKSGTFHLCKVVSCNEMLLPEV